MWLQNQNKPFEFIAPGTLEMIQESVVPKPQTKQSDLCYGLRGSSGSEPLTLHDLRGMGPPGRTDFTQGKPCHKALGTTALES